MTTQKNGPRLFKISSSPYTIYSLENGKISPFGLTTEPGKTYQLEQLYNAIPDVEALLANNSFYAHPEITFLDETGPTILSVYEATPDAEAFDPTFEMECKNQQEAEILKEYLYSAILVREDAEERDCVVVIRPVPTSITPLRFNPLFRW